MSILTHEMTINRGAYKGQNCKLFFPFNDGSGTAFTDLVSGEDYTAGSANHTDEAHAPTVNGADTTFSYAATLKMNKPTLMVYVYKVETLENFGFFTVGSETANAGIEGGIRLNEDSAFVNFGDTTEDQTLTNAISPAVDSVMVLAVTVDGSDITLYQGDDADAAQTATVALSAANQTYYNNSSLPFADKIEMNSVAQHVYGAALFQFQDGFPSDLLAGINYMKDNWTAGRKFLPPTWTTLV